MAAMDDGRPTIQTQFPRVGRPRKSPHEKRRKQQEATKWRDARRVYLGNSYDRWKKLKSRIGLKDSSLAWHLMEAHASHCVECGKGAGLGDSADDTPHNFYPQLIRSIRRICLQYLSFQHTVEVVGLVCLEIDKGEKENFSIKEVVNRPIGLRVEALTSQHASVDHSPDVVVDDDDDEDEGDDNMYDEDDDMSEISNDSVTEMPENSSVTDDPDPSFVHNSEEYVEGDNLSELDDHNQIPETNCDNNVPLGDDDPEQRTDNSSLTCQPLTAMQGQLWQLEQASAESDTTDKSKTSQNVETENVPLDMAVIKHENLFGNSTVLHTPAEDSGGSYKTGYQNDPVPHVRDPPVNISKMLPTHVDLQTSPMNLKVIKQETSDPPQSTTQSRQDSPFPGLVRTPDSSTKKRKYGCVEPPVNSHKKEVFHKEEYEVLEMTPFTDYAEFSRHCPSVLPRTFYRWKRRIKDEYIFLEQNPHISYQEFLQYIPHAKENVFNFWKSLMKKGYLFGTSSASHLKTLSLKYESEGRKVNSVSSQPQWDEESSGHKVLQYMQKNLAADFAEVSKKFPHLPEHVFKVWKQQNLQAWNFIEQNFFTDYSLFVRCFPTVSEEIFNFWRQTAARENRTKIMSLQREAVSTAQHIQEAQKALWTSFISRRIAQEHGSFSPGSGTWPALAGGWLGGYPGFGAAGMNFPSLHMDPNQCTQPFQQEVKSERNKTPNSDISDGAQTEKCSSPSKTSRSDSEDPDSNFLAKCKKQNKAEFYYYLQNPDMDFTEMSKLYPTVSLRSFYRWKREIKTALAYLEDYPECNFEMFQSFFSEIPIEIYQQWRSKISSELAEREVHKQTVQEEREKPGDDLQGRDFSRESRDENLNMKREDQCKQDHRHEYLCLQLSPTLKFEEYTYQCPNISLETFCSWQKEITERISFMVESPDISFRDFHKVYPDVTEHVFEAWKKLVQSERENQNGFDSDSQRNLADGEESFLNLDKQELHSTHTKKMKLSSLSNESPVHSNNISDTESVDSNGVLEYRTFMKITRPEYRCLQENPDMDLQTFLQMFPDLSQGTFYRWRKEIKAESEKNPIKSLQALVNAGETYATNGNYHQEPGFLFLLENPFTSIVEFSKLYPSVAGATFSRWKKMVREWIGLVKLNPDIEFQTFSLYCCDVPESVFIKWKEILSSKSGSGDEKCDLDGGCMSELSASMREDWVVTKTRKVNQTEYLFFLMNPYMDYSEFAVTFPQISQRTFYRWRREIRESLEYLEQHPDVSFKAFFKVFPVVPEEVFIKWKELSSEKNKKVEMSSESLKKSLLEKGSQNIAEVRTEGESEEEKCSEDDCPNLTIDFPRDRDTPDSTSSAAQMSALSSSESLSAAVESICRSAGLPPLDQNVTEPERSQETSTCIGGVAFPGMSTASGQRELSNHHLLSTVKQEKLHLESLLESRESPGSATPPSTKFGPSYQGMATGASYFESPSGVSPQMLKEESFFSPRARKQSREEYLFLQQNPNMDFMEFCSHYPTISLRTFYRWKREFRQSKDYMIGLSSSLM